MITWLLGQVHNCIIVGLDEFVIVDELVMFLFFDTKDYSQSIYHTVVFTLFS